MCCGNKRFRFVAKVQIGSSRAKEARNQQALQLKMKVACSLLPKYCAAEIFTLPNLRLEVRIRK